MILTREKKETWNLFEKISFRFLLLYFTLYVLSIFTASLWEPVIQWIGTSIFNIEYDFSSNGRGSGDTTYAYLLLFLFFCISSLGSIIWSFIDAKRMSYNQLQYGFLVSIRVVLIFFLFQYGIIKMFHLQMSPISNSDLIQTFGSKSPMGLAWKFMGFSSTYSFFAGLSEVIAGLLLISRRTQTYGAIATIVVMLNVFMMNLCFDIPVKIFSFHLMLLGALILFADFKRVFGVLIQNKNIGDYVLYPQLKKGDRTIIIIAKCVLLFVISALFIFTSYPRYKKNYVNPKTALYGIWEVSDYKKGTETNPKKQWKYIAIDQAKFASIKTLDDTQSYYKFKVDTLTNTILFADRSNEIVDTLTFKKMGNNLFVSGKIENDSILVQLKKKPKTDFLLTSRGFNWINEYPLNK